MMTTPALPTTVMHSLVAFIRLKTAMMETSAPLMIATQLQDVSIPSRIVMTMMSVRTTDVQTEYVHMLRYLSARSPVIMQSVREKALHFLLQVVLLIYGKDQMASAQLPLRLVLSAMPALIPLQ